MKYYLLFIFICMFRVASAQAPAWEWAVSAGDTLDEIPTGIVVDHNGNSYVCGYFGSGSLTLGDTILYNPANNSSPNLTNVFLVKYDPSGNVVWAKGAGGYYMDAATSIALDPNGYLYMCGYFTNHMIAFDGDTIYGPGLTFPDFFVVKYDLNGNEQWALSASGDFDDGLVSCVAADGAGNCYVAGMTHSSFMQIGSFWLPNPDQTNATSDLFLAKIDPGGTTLWAQSSSIAGDESVNAIAADPSGRIFITGDFNGSSLTLGSTTLTNASSNSDVFTAAYDTNGNLLWAVRAGSTGNEHATGITSDHSGNVYSTGTFFGSPTVIGPYTLTNAGYDDFYVARYDTSGNLHWAVSAGGNRPDHTTSITTDTLGHVVVGGNFQTASLTFGNSTVTDASVQNDPLIVAFDSTSGTPLWAQSAAGTDPDGVNAITCDGASVFATGQLMSTSLSFSSTVLQNSHPNVSSYDLWLAKLDPLLGIYNPLPAASISVYPNPSKGIFRFDTGAGALLDIMDAQGRCILQTVSTGDELTVDLTGKAKGLYLYHITDATGKTSAGKLILD